MLHLAPVAHLTIIFVGVVYVKLAGWCHHVTTSYWKKANWIIYQLLFLSMQTKVAHFIWFKIPEFDNFPHYFSRDKTIACKIHIYILNERNIEYYMQFISKDLRKWTILLSKIPCIYIVILFYSRHIHIENKSWMSIKWLQVKV